MDASHSPDPPEGGDDPSQPASEDGEQGSSLISSFLSRVTGRFTPETQDDEEDGEQPALGAAFDRSSPAERAMVTNIIRMREKRVEDVMTPRADIIAVSEDASLEDVMEALHRGSLSRLPVYHETLDDPLGFVHLKDLALAHGVGRASEDDRPFSLRDHLRTALYVPPSMRIASLMQKMQAERVHMALVIDEFGGVDGLVTIEDLVEQIVGDIEDEHDVEERALWRAETDGVYIVDARADVSAFAEAEGIALLPGDWEEDIDTMGGLVFMLTGRVPTRGEVIFHPEGHEFEVIDADPRRIRRLRLTLAGAAQTRRPATRAAE